MYNRRDDHPPLHLLRRQVWRRRGQRRRHLPPLLRRAIEHILLLHLWQKRHFIRRWRFGPVHILDIVVMCAAPSDGKPPRQLALVGLVLGGGIGQTPVEGQPVVGADASARPQLIA